MRVIKLSHGVGNGVDTACLMTASNMLIGKGEEGDQNRCVCPVIRAFIIQTNDRMPQEWLGEIYGPLVFEILGTKSDAETERKRAYFFADKAIRYFAPIALRATGLSEWAEKLEACSPVVDVATALAARAVTLDAKKYAYAAAAAYAAADPAVAATAAATAAAAAAAYADPAAYAARKPIWQKCAEIILEACAIGDKRPVERTISDEQLAERLCGCGDY